jgi:plastocyanin
MEKRGPYARGLAGRLAAVCALLLLGVGLAAARAAAPADKTVYALPSTVFSPNDITIAQGEKVTWDNMGGTHNVRFGDGSFEMPMDPEPAPWTVPVQRAFNTPETYTYYCEAHPAMTGVVRVTPATPAPEPPPPGAPGPAPPAPGAGPPPATPPGARLPIKVTLKVSDRTPQAGQRVRLFGPVRPALDGQTIRIQRRTRNGSFQTVAKTKLRDAGDERSKFSRRVRIFRDSVFRARVAAGANHEAGTSSKKRLNVT